LVKNGVIIHELISLAKTAHARHARLPHDGQRATSVGRHGRQGSADQATPVETMGHRVDTRVPDAVVTVRMHVRTRATDA
jgi:hypothetical protein